MLLNLQPLHLPQQQELAIMLLNLQLLHPPQQQALAISQPCNLGSK
jgi:hypothetical protein